MSTDHIQNHLFSANLALELFTAFAFIDGELDDSERSILREACTALNLPDAILNERIDFYSNNKNNYEDLCFRALDAIADKNSREQLIGTLCDIATADGHHHQNEIRFLNAVRDRWGMNVSIGRSLKWDPDQKAVVQADYKDRLIVHAGPGMGKTAVACARVSDLLEQRVEAENIWMLSFTRTAVKEIRDRISCFCDQNLSSLGIKIATIDSKAWRIRYGLTDDEVRNLFGNHDRNIEEVLNLFETNREELHENFSSLEHVIIDEAQDITGARAELLLNILKMLNPECGFTIFADPAQAIYGFTNDYDDHSTEDQKSFLNMVKEAFGDNIRELELKTIHRTNNSKLIKLIEDLRLDIYINDNVDKDSYRERSDFVRRQADVEVGDFNSRDLTNQDDTLVLFRRRSEVLRASSIACKDGVKHRIRMSGQSAGIFSWVAHVFFDCTDRQMQKSRFLELCHARKYMFEGESTIADFELWWEALLETAGVDGAVDISKLRTKLSRSSPPLSLCYPETGFCGPILGTIHASKGREADHVVLRLPGTHISKSNFDEESRVLFVGATRAKSRLSVGNGFIRQLFAKSLPSGRAYASLKNKEPYRYGLASVEIGLEKELDDYSFVSNESPLSDVIERQRRLIDLGRTSPAPMQAFLDSQKDYSYTIWTSSAGQSIDKPIGRFSQTLNADLFGIARFIGKGFYKVPPSLGPIYMVGLKTVCKSEDDPNLKIVHKPYSQSGFWTVPVLVGYPNCLFPTKRRR